MANEIHSSFPKNVPGMRAFARIATDEAKFGMSPVGMHGVLECLDLSALACSSGFFVTGKAVDM